MTKWLSLVALLAIAIVSGYVLRDLDDEEKDNDGDVAHIPEFFMEMFTITVMDERGLPKRELRAQYMAQFADNQTKELEEPYLVVHQENQPPWHIKSERGWVSANDDVMLLLGQVHVWRDNDAGLRDLEILTQDLRVLPSTQYAETDKPVIIRTPSSETKSIGMRAYLEQRRLELLSGVNKVYEQNNN